MEKCYICKKMFFSDNSVEFKDGLVCDDCLQRVFNKTPHTLKESERQKFRNLTIEEWQKKSNDEEEERIIEANHEKEILAKKKNIIVSTCDIKQDYEIIAPVYFQVNNRGDQFSTLSKKYEDLFSTKEQLAQLSGDRITGWEVFQTLFITNAATIAHNQFDKAFFIAVEELKERAARLGADAVIGMRYDLDLDTNLFQYFYLQMYGTAVRYL